MQDPHHAAGQKTSSTLGRHQGRNPPTPTGKHRPKLTPSVRPGRQHNTEALHCQVRTCSAFLSGHWGLNRYSGDLCRRLSTSYVLRYLYRIFAAGSLRRRLGTAERTPYYLGVALLPPQQRSADFLDAQTAHLPPPSLG